MLLGLGYRPIRVFKGLDAWIKVLFGSVWLDPVGSVSTSACDGHSACASQQRPAGGMKWMKL